MEITEITGKYEEYQNRLIINRQFFDLDGEYSSMNENPYKWCSEYK